MVLTSVGMVLGLSVRVVDVVVTVLPVWLSCNSVRVCRERLCGLLGSVVTVFLVSESVWRGLGLCTVVTVSDMVLVGVSTMSVCVFVFV